MKCFICGKTPADGVNLYRQNPKGVAGIFACYAHSKPVDDDLVRVIGVIQKSGIPETTITIPKRGNKNEATK
jgi:hypothetical protein